MKLKTVHTHVPSTIAVEIGESCHDMACFAIQDIFTSKIKAGTVMLNQFLHIGPLNKYIIYFMELFAGFTGFFIDDNSDRFKKLPSIVGLKQHCFYMSIGPAVEYDNTQFDEAIPFLSPTANLIAPVRPYPFKRKFSFISLCNGSFSYDILKQIDLTGCQVLAIECGLSYPDWDETTNQYLHAEQNREQIVAYCGKFGMIHMHTSENLLIFSRI